MQRVLNIKNIFACFLVLALCLGLGTITRAEEPKSYIYMLKSGESEAKWYNGDPVIGAEGEVTVADMVEAATTRYYIMAEPSEDVVAYLNDLDEGAFIQIYSKSGKIVLGTEEKPFQIDRISLDSNDFELTVYTDGLQGFSLTYGTAVINGDITAVSLGNDNMGRNEDKQNLTVNGDVEYLTWYRDSDSKYDSFKGDFYVSGIVANGSIYDRVNLEGFGTINPNTYTFKDATGLIISEGVLSEDVTCSGTNFAEAEYSYRYDCYCWKGWSGNDWEMFVFANGSEFVGNKYLVDFDPADLPDDAELMINSNYGDDALVIPKSVKKLHVYGGGKIVVEGDVEELIVEWNYPDNSLSKQTIELTVTGNVKNLELRGRCRQVNLVVSGNVETGIWWTRYFAGTGSIMNEGQLQIPSFNSLEEINKKDAVGTITPAMEELEGAANISEEDAVLDELGNVIAGKLLQVKVSENKTLEELQIEELEQKNDLDVVGIVDIQLLSGYYDVSNGNTYEDANHKTEEVKELSKAVPVILTIPEEVQDNISVFSVIREHEGVFEVLQDIDNDPATVTVMSDKFSAYMLVRSEDVPELIPESQKPNFSDVKETSWQYVYVQYAYDNGLMTGKGKDENGNIIFDPDKAIPREEFVQVLYNASGKPEVNIENVFPDVKDAWYKNAVLWADANDIANGKGDGNFGVTESISRQDLALMLYKYACLNGYDLTANTGEINKYADGNKVSSYAKTAMDWAITKGIMSGKGNKGEDISTFKLDPTGTATRAECAAMLKNFMEVYKSN